MKTALFNKHCALNAKIIDFCGWEMPLQYKGIVSEHLAVRHEVGLFDVSHMGRITVEGPEAESLLNYLSTNDISKKENGSVLYTLWCQESGCCLDDLLIYKETATKFFVIVNACNRQKDLEHLRTYAKAKNVSVVDHYNDEGILSLQGPFADRLITKLFPEVEFVKSMHFIYTTFQGQKIGISRTGYTGSGGVEIFGPQKTIVALWDLLLSEGKVYAIQPIGLGARDTLRLEMGYVLYGHELTESVAATESVASWAVKLRKPDFLGRNSLEKLEDSPQKRKACGIVLADKGIPRQGYPVLKNGKTVGIVTSGTFSPCLNKGIGLVLVEKNLNIGDSVEVEIRQKAYPAKLVALPFLGLSVRCSRKIKREM